MKNKIFYLLSMSIAFCMGVLVTYMTMMKKEMDSVFNTSQQYDMNEVVVQSDIPSNKDITQDTYHENTSNQVAKMVNSSKQNGVNLNQFSEKKAKQLVQEMPDYVLEQYIDKFLVSGAQDVIQDKRRFAERAIEELYKPNDNQKLVGTANISFSDVMSASSADTSHVSKFVKIYAHLDTNGKIPANKHVFIKWVNNQTGQVLLFEKKNISMNSQQNWVSFVPTDGWQTGSYDVRFYQFTSELEPIAQTTYEIYEVVD